MAKSRMPVFDADDEEELNRIINRDAQDIFKKNIPIKKTPNTISSNKKQPPVQSVNSMNRPPPVVESVAPIDGHVKPLLKPNSDWRAAMTSPAYYTTNPLNKAAYSKKPIVVKDDAFTDPFEEDFSYEDMENAMREEHFYRMGDGGGGGLGIKHSRAARTQEGLSSGDLLPPYAWTWLRTAEGEQFEYSMAHKNTSDVLVLLVDPRRMNNEFVEYVRQLGKVPRGPLGVEVVAVNCDAAGDIKKFVRKSGGSVTVSVLSDTSKKWMEQLKCKSPSRLAAALIILDVASSKILRIWYENDWDAFATKDLLVEEIAAYRRSPTQYIQSQIGIR